MIKIFKSKFLLQNLNMRWVSLVLVCFVLSCSDENIGKSKKSEFQVPNEIQTIVFPCGKFNGSDDWVNCIPVEIDLFESGLESAIMTYNMYTTRGTSEMIAELYDITNGKSIYQSDVKALTNLSVFTKPQTMNILEQLPKEPVQLVIRFRNSEVGAEGYINDYSYLTLVYK